MSRGDTDADLSSVDLARSIASRDLETSVLAVRKISDLVSELAEASVERLLESPQHAWMYAEGIWGIVEAVRRSVVKAYDANCEGATEQSINLGLLLLDLGDDRAVDLLASCLETGLSQRAFVADKLVRSGHMQCVPRILAALEVERDEDTILSYLDTLRLVGVELTPGAEHDPLTRWVVD